MLKFIFLGILQGATEFLPISSSAHLLVAGRLIDLNVDKVAFFLVLHLGTLFAVCIFFFREIIRVLADIKLFLFVLIVTAVTGIIGIMGKGFFESLFNSVLLISFTLAINGLILIKASKYTESKRDSADIKDALVLGLSQAISIMPGISRSGITISSLLFRGMDRDTSFRLSFIVSIPVIIGATLLEARNINLAFDSNIGGFLAGFIASLLAGIISLLILKAVLRRARFQYFGYYCIIIAVVNILFLR